MIFDIVTLFPEMFSALEASLLGRAEARGLFALWLTNPRDFAEGKHRSVDDTPYGGGAGMVMRPDPLVKALESVEAARGSAHKVLLAPAGATLTRAKVVELAARSHVALVCGRYEGIDERVRGYVDEELSIGDYVLTGGELAAMVIVDAVVRRLPGVLGNDASALDESFEAGLLEYPHYTRPAEFRGAPVPEVLSSGNHERIRRWRRKAQLARTRRRRPELFEKLALDDGDRRIIEELDAGFDEGVGA